MTYTEKRLEEFEEMFPTLRQDLPNGIYMYSRMDFPEGDLRAIKPFINKLIHQALAEERERLREIILQNSTEEYIGSVSFLTVNTDKLMFALSPLKNPKSSEKTEEINNKYENN